MASRSGAGRERATAGTRRYSLRQNLLLLIVVCVLPAIVVSAYLVSSNYRLLKQRIYGDTVLLARQIMSEVDRELSGIESGLRLLATAQALENDDLVAFHKLASDALRSQPVYNYILTDSRGRQLLNTLRPVGAPLPESGTPAQLADVFRQQRAVLTDMFVGPVTGKPAVAMGVPVMRDGAVIYSLNIGLAPERLSEIVQRQPLPAGWLAAVLDSQGTIVARSREAERYVGQKAVPDLIARVAAAHSGSLETHTRDGVSVVSSFQRSEHSGWAVVVGAPRDILQAQLYRMLGWLTVASGLFVLGLWLAVRLANRVLVSVQQLNDAARALGKGSRVALPEVQLLEAEAVGQAIAQASEQMAEVHHRANHDALTGLANRALFLELLQFQLMQAQREPRELALLAIDLDHFKQVNDEEGHASGDRLLRIVGERIAGTLRASDAAARAGGDEFWVLLCDADEDRAAETARRLLAALREPYAGVRTPVSASIGIAIYPQHGREPQQLLESADRALYAAKRAGRDRLAIG